jgi:ankyrin repeat protein
VGNFSDDPTVKVMRELRNVSVSEIKFVEPLSDELIIYLNSLRPSSLYHLAFNLLINNKLDDFKVLVEYTSFDINRKFSDDSTMLGMLCENLEACSLKNDFQSKIPVNIRSAISYLLREFKLDFSKGETFGWSPLYHFSYKSVGVSLDIRTVFELIYQAGVNPNHANEVGNTLLHKALRAKDYRLVSYYTSVFKSSLDWNIKNKNGYTPGHLLVNAVGGDAEELLSQALPKLDVSVVDANGMTVLAIAVLSGKPLSLFQSCPGYEKALSQKDCYGYSAQDWALRLQNIEHASDIIRAEYLIDNAVFTEPKDFLYLLAVYRKQNPPELYQRTLNDIFYVLAPRQEKVALARAILLLGADVNYIPRQLGYCAHNSMAMDLAAMNANENWVKELMWAGGMVGSVTDIGVALSTLNKSNIYQLIVKEFGREKLNRLSNGRQTMLMAAAATNDVALLKWVIQNGESLSTRDSYGRNALHWALIGQSNDAALLLIDSCPMLVDVADIAGMTPLMWAALYRNEILVEALIAAGADVNKRTIAGNSPLLFARRVKNQDKQVEKLLLDNGADSSVTNLLASKELIPVDHDVCTNQESGELCCDLVYLDFNNQDILALMNEALRLLKAEKDITAVLHDIYAFGEEIGSYESEEIMTQLMCALTELILTSYDLNQEELTRFIDAWNTGSSHAGRVPYHGSMQFLSFGIALGADLNARCIDRGRGQSKETYLSLLIRESFDFNKNFFDPLIYQMLHNFGADINIQDFHGNIPAHLAVASNHGAWLFQWLMANGANHAIKDADGDDLLLNLASVCRESNAEDGLHRAFAILYFDQLIQSVGVERLCLESKNKEGVNFINYACEAGYYFALNVLRNKLGEKIFLSLQSEPSNEGANALHTAVKRGFVDIVNMLITMGVDLHATDNNGNTALHLAASSKSLPIVKLLLEAGVNPNLRNHFQETPAMLAVTCSDWRSNQYYLFAPDENSEPIIDAHLPTEQTDGQSTRAMHLLNLLKSKGAKLTGFDVAGNSILLFAIAEKSWKVVADLLRNHHAALQHGARHANSNGETPLMWMTVCRDLMGEPSRKVEDTLIAASSVHHEDAQGINLLEILNEEMTWNDLDQALFTRNRNHRARRTVSMLRALRTTHLDQVVEEVTPETTVGIEATPEPAVSVEEIASAQSIGMSLN